MINKVNLLHHTPEQAGIKDAIHVAIVSVRAAHMIKPGQRCGLNEYNEAVTTSKGSGVANPFLKKNIQRGELFFLLLDMQEVPNVQHTWEHPKIKKFIPSREIELNSTIKDIADRLKVSYADIMKACEYAVNNRDNSDSLDYPGPLSEEEFEEAHDDLWDLWGEWACETDYEFENQGSACCPEYDYPSSLYHWVDKEEEVL